MTENDLLAALVADIPEPVQPGEVTIQMLLYEAERAGKPISRATAERRLNGLVKAGLATVRKGYDKDKLVNVYRCAKPSDKP